MRQFSRLATILCLTALLSACASVPEEMPTAPISATAGGKLNVQAKQALAQAEADAAAAAKASALWLPAENALLAARAAADVGDNLSVLELAKRVSELCRLGMEQMRLPGIERR
jgi:flagellar basal body L-ring protein FlgH